MKKSLSILIPALLVVGACTSRIGADQYATNATGTVNTAVRCTVVNVRPVVVQSNNNAGMLVGGAAGAVAGSMIGGSDAAHILGGIGGAVVGGLAGDAAQSGLSKQQGYEYIVETNTGKLLTITQGNDVLLSPGQKCMVLYGDQARIIPAN